MLQSLSGKDEIVQQLCKQLGEELYHCISEYPANLNFKVISELIQPPARAITENEIAQLQLFAHGQRPYELVAGILLNWFNLHFQQLDLTSASILAARLWHKQSWQQICQRFNLDGKAACIKLIRQSIYD